MSSVLARQEEASLDDTEGWQWGLVPRRAQGISLKRMLVHQQEKEEVS